MKLIARILCITVLFVSVSPNTFTYAEETSGPPTVDNITIENNADKKDTVYIAGLNGKDVVKVYSSAVGGTVLGSATVGTNNTYVTINISQLGTSEGSIYISDTSKDMLESSRVKVDYDAEPQTEAPSASNIAITNNAGISDTIDITGLFSSEVVKVYNSETGKKVLATKTVGSSSSTLTITLGQIGSKDGTVYITGKNADERESERTKVGYTAEPNSTPIDKDNVTITNNAGIQSTAYITGLDSGDLVKIYKASSGGTLLGSGRVATNKIDITVNISNLAMAGGDVYITTTSKGKTESTRTDVPYLGKPTTVFTNSNNNILITNNTGSADKVYVSGLATGDLVKVYDPVYAGKVLGSATASSTNLDATVSISQLGKVSGFVYITVTSKGMIESGKVSVSYSAESSSSDLADSDIVVTNNSGKSDTVVVSNLSSGDLVKVYDSSSGGKVLGSVTATSDQATVTITQLGTSAGSVYVSITNKGKLEGIRVQATYSDESQSTDPSPGNILISNNGGVADKINLVGLTSGDLVNVYDSTGKLIGSGTVATYATTLTISIDQLGTTAGTVSVSVTSTNKKESKRISVSYSAENTSTAPILANITVSNNSAVADTVKVSGLTGLDVVNVYDKSGNMIGSTTLTTSDTQATVTISQLGTTAGTVFVSVTSTSKRESTRTSVDYLAESASTGLDKNNIIITNNTGVSDTVRVISLTKDDVVKVYDAKDGGNLLGSGTVAAASTELTVTIAQLGVTAGDVYVSLSSKNKAESDRVDVPYSAETPSTEPSTSNIVVTNNALVADTVVVSNLTSGDIVKVYDSASGVNVIGTATVAASGNSVSIPIAQLGTTAGNVYVSVTSTNKLESDRATAAYSSEAISVAPTDITVNNNALSSDTITVKGIKSGDIVKVYDTATGSNVLGTATVTDSNNSVTITVAQLGTTAGSVYVTVTSTNKTESARTTATYTKEPTSVAPTDITVTNNSLASDVVTVKLINVGDVVNVYDSATGGKLLGTATVAASSNSATITINQLGSTSGSVFVSITSSNKLESSRTEKTYDAESTSAAPTNVTIVNNAGKDSTVRLTGLTDNDVVNVYDSAVGGKLLGTSTVTAYSTTTTVTITTLSSGDGSVYITVTSKDKLESTRAKFDYSGKVVSTTPDSANITIANNASIASTVRVTNLLSGDIVNVYDSATNGKLLGTATVATYDTEVTVSVPQLSLKAGTVWVTVTSTGKTESSRIDKAYDAQPASIAPILSNITIKNYAGLPDTIKVTGIDANSVVNVYADNTTSTVLGTATVPSDSMEATVSITQIGTTSGTLYISVITPKKVESSRTPATYDAEAASDAPMAGNIVIKNNSGIADTIEVSALLAGDQVKIYNAATGGSQIGTTATVPTDGTDVTISITQLGTSAGSVYVSVISTGKTESSRTTAEYVAESVAPDSANITIVNNAVLEDTITVSNLSANDVIKMYDAKQGGTLLGSAVVTSTDTSATIKIAQLSQNAGSVYVSVTSFGKGESSRTKADFIAEAASSPIDSSRITIVNNIEGVANDTVTITGCSKSDLIKVYDSSAGGTLIGSVTVGSAIDSGDGTIHGVVSVKQLLSGSGGGTVYITITNLGKTESTRVAGLVGNEQ